MSFFEWLLLSTLWWWKTLMVLGLELRIITPAETVFVIEVVFVHSWINIRWSRFALWGKYWQSSFCLFVIVFHAVVIQLKILDLLPTCQMYRNHKREKLLFCKRNSRSNLFYECCLAFFTWAQPQGSVFSSEQCSRDEQWKSEIYYSQVEYNSMCSRLRFLYWLIPEV